MSSVDTVAVNNLGTIVEIIGAVVDVEFPRESVPRINDALTLTEGDLVFEVQQQLGDGVVRTIAMGTTDGLKRGVQVENTKKPIQVPVGKKTLGRIMDVLGRPVMMQAQSVLKNIGLFTARLQATKSKQEARKF